MFGLTFDFAAFVNTTIGAIVGGLISFGISYWFFLRGKGHEKLSSWMSDSIGLAFIQQQSPQFFQSSAIRPTFFPRPPQNKDVPRLHRLFFSKASVVAGQDLEILCRVIDEKWNFLSPSGLSIIDHHGVRHAVRFASFGYMQARIQIPKSDSPGTYRLTFEMQDEIGNAFCQKTDFEIVLNEVSSPIYDYSEPMGTSNCSA